jgi:hypothetical protein
MILGDVSLFPWFCHNIVYGSEKARGDLGGGGGGCGLLEMVFFGGSKTSGSHGYVPFFMNAEWGSLGDNLSYHNIVM